MPDELSRSLREGSAGSESVLSAEATWEGKIRSRGDLRIEGIVHGELETSGSLTVAARAHVDGTVLANKVVLAGEIEGQVLCNERLEMLSGCRLEGDIETGSLVVQEGAHLEAKRFSMLKSKQPRDRRAG